MRARIYLLSHANEYAAEAHVIGHSPLTKPFNRTILCVASGAWASLPDRADRQINLHLFMKMLSYRCGQGHAMERAHFIQGTCVGFVPDVNLKISTQLAII